MAKEERTEKATPKRRREARNKGQVAKSQEINSALILISGLVALRWIGPYILHNIGDLIRVIYSDPYAIDITKDTIPAFFFELMLVFAKLAFPMMAISLIVGLVASFSQVGFMMTAQPVTPQLNRLNPITGFQRLFSARALVELLKAFVKISAVLYIAFSVMRDRYQEFASLVELDINQSLAFVGQIAYNIGLRAGLVLLILAMFDYAYQRFEHEKSIRMTKKEIKEEHKQTEGDPKVKSRIRQKQIQMATSRMMQEVPKADVVITNPTHVAVALKYDAGTMNAPKVLAKGQRLIAKKIRDIAEEHRVPIVEDAPLAQSIFGSTEPGGEIPYELYQAVAEILAYVYEINRRP